MRNKIKKHVRACRKCQMTAPARKNERVPLQKVDVIKQSPFAISVDFVGCQYPKTTRGNKFLMVIIDNFTRWPQW